MNKLLFRDNLYVHWKGMVKFMKKSRIIIIIVLCVGMLVGGYTYWLNNNSNSSSENVELTKVQQLITKDLEKNYPKTPREVVKFYNRIVQCYHTEGLSKDEVGKLVDQMMLLWDADMLAKNPREEYYMAVLADIQLYKQTKKTITSITICDINDVDYVTDDRNGDKLAFVDTTYFVNTDGKFTNSYMRVGVRQDANGNWKIIGVTLKEGESSKDDE